MKIASQILLVLVAGAFYSAHAVIGVSVIGLPASNWTCLSTFGTDAFITCNNFTDSYCSYNYNGSVYYNMQRVDIVTNGSIQTQSAASYVQSIYDYTKKYNMVAGVWYNINQQTGNWSTNVTTNQNWIVQLANTSQPLFNFGFGFYSRATDWANLFGANFTHPLLDYAYVWYYSGDGAKSFSDWAFRGFGQWDRPSMKTYSNSTYCGGLDLVFHP